MSDKLTLLRLSESFKLLLGAVTRLNAFGLEADEVYDEIYELNIQ